MKTKVIFLIDGNEANYSPNKVFAFFPDEMYSNDINLRTCYSHIGQHGACHIDYVSESRHAVHAEFKELWRELCRIGYDLQIQDKYGNDVN